MIDDILQGFYRFFNFGHGKPSDPFSHCLVFSDIYKKAIQYQDAFVFVFDCRPLRCESDGHYFIFSAGSYLHDIQDTHFKMSLDIDSRF